VRLRSQIADQNKNIADKKSPTPTLAESDDAAGVGCVELSDREGVKGTEKERGEIERGEI
jgi:hypothetical protein